MALTKRTEYPIAVRKHIATNILRFRSDIKKSVEYHLANNTSMNQKIAGTYL